MKRWYTAGGDAAGHATILLTLLLAGGGVTGCRRREASVAADPPPTRVGGEPAPVTRPSVKPAEAVAAVFVINGQPSRSPRPSW